MTKGKSKAEYREWTIYEFYEEYDRLIQQINKAKQDLPPDDEQF